MKNSGFYWLVIGGFLLFSCKGKEVTETAAPEVSVASVLVKDVPIAQEYVGQTLGGEDIQIMARVQGFLTGMYFKEGSFVNKGQLLYSIDPLPYQAKLDQAKGQLGEVQAYYAQAESDLARIKPLAAINAVSIRDLDAAQAKFDAAVARKQAGEAIVRNAEIELGYTRLSSPIDGIIGLSQYQVGDLVGTIGQRYLNTVSNTKTLRVRNCI
jgi:membrane fusion protein, multidrug efflux system